MEKNSEYLTWMMKRKQQVKPKLNQSSSSMEDDDKVLTWPPRSYSCSFCKREFRSAQSLGGHMNVHRRDRAKLKQSNNAANITATAPSPAPTIFFHENYYSGGNHQKGCNNKRQRIKTVSFMPVVHEPCLSSHKNSGMEEINLWMTREIRNHYHYPTEEIDLELRVGICRAS